jgi:hypothetical protein
VVSLVILSAGATILNAGAVPVREPYNVSVSGKVLTFRGQIAAGSASRVSQLMRQANGAVRIFRITSAGGDGAEALRIAEIVRRNALDVEVESFCISGCAQYIFIAGKSKHVYNNSIVAFHGTPSALRFELSRSSLNKASSLFKRQSELEKKFYRDIGVSSNLLIGSIHHLDPECVVENLSLPLNNSNRYGIQLKFPAYIISLESLNDIGVKNISGFWPKSLEQVRAILKQLPFNSAFQVQYSSALKVASVENLNHKKYAVCRYRL